MRKLKTRTYLWDESIQGWIDSFGQYAIDGKHIEYVLIRSY